MNDPHPSSCSIETEGAHVSSPLTEVCFSAFQKGLSLCLRGCKPATHQISDCFSGWTPFVWKALKPGSALVLLGGFGGRVKVGDSDGGSMDSVFRRRQCWADRICCRPFRRWISSALQWVEMNPGKSRRRSGRVNPLKSRRRNVWCVCGGLIVC